MSKDVEVRESETVGLPGILRPGEGVLVEGSGVDVDVTDPVQCAVALDFIRTFEKEIAHIKRVLTDGVVNHYRLTGERSIDLPGGLEATVKAGKRTLVDPAVLEVKLREAGMPEDRINQIITSTQETRVDLRKAKTAATANDAYAEALAAASSTYEETPAVTIRRR